MRCTAHVEQMLWRSPALLWCCWAGLLPSDQGYLTAPSRTHSHQSALLWQGSHCRHWPAQLGQIEGWQGYDSCPPSQLEWSPGASVPDLVEESGQGVGRAEEGMWFKELAIWIFQLTLNIYICGDGLIKTSVCYINLQLVPSPVSSWPLQLNEYNLFLWKDY